MDQNSQIQPTDFFHSFDFTSDWDEPPVDAGPIDFAGMDERPTPRAAKQKPNPFAVIESKLRLPDGSTEQALAVLKKNTTNIAKTAASFQNQANNVVAAQQQVAKGYAKIDPEQLRSDRERIRSEAFEMYENVKELFMSMKETFMGTVSPPPNMCTAIATMVNSVQQSLDKLIKVVQVLREEGEHYDEKYVKPEVKEEDVENQTYDFSPTQMADLVELWDKKAEEKRKEDLDREFASRSPAQITDESSEETKLIEQKT